VVGLGVCGLVFADVPL